MTETLQRATVEYQDPLSDNESAVNTENAVLESAISPEQDQREASPFGAELIRAANRVNALLTKRAVNRAQKEGIVMNAAYDKVTQFNKDHSEALAMNDAESSSAYERSYDEAIIENRNVDHNEALVMNKAYDKAERREKRADQIENAKQKVRIFGRQALRSTKNAGLITLGAGIIGAESAGRGIKSGAESTYVASLIAKDKISSAAETGILKSLYAADKARELSSSTKDILISKMNKARERSAVRKEKWSNKYNSLKNQGIEKIENAKTSARVTRTAGRMAVNAFRDHREAFKNQ